MMVQMGAFCQTTNEKCKTTVYLILLPFFFLSSPFPFSFSNSNVFFHICSETEVWKTRQQEEHAPIDALQLTPYLDYTTIHTATLLCNTTIIFLTCPSLNCSYFEIWKCDFIQTRAILNLKSRRLRIRAWRRRYDESR